MSGPKTAEYDIVDILVLAANAHREWQQQREETQARQKAEQQRLDTLHREAERQRREQENARLAAAQTAADDAERGAQRLERLAKSAGIPAAIARPAAVSHSDVNALEHYALTLAAEAARLETQLRASLAGKVQLVSAATLTRLGQSRTAAELLDAYAAKSGGTPGRQEAGKPQQRRERALHILGRLSGTAANAIPPAMEALMAELIDATDDTRAEAMELELRLQVQGYNDEQERRQQALAAAHELLAALPDVGACDGARQELELVAAGLAPLTDGLRQRARIARTAGEEELAQARRERASAVLAQTLQDLGYAVDGIENTLFVEGGVAHFNKAEWGDYCVRMRVDPRDQTANFNVVRESEDVAGADHTAADLAAESSWCSGLPQLLKTLEARGLRMKIGRHIAAGTMPVQLVEPGTLPQSLKAKTGTHAAAPKARTMDS